MLKKLFMCLLIAAPIFMASTAVAETVKIYCPCGTNPPLVYAPAKAATQKVVARPATVASSRVIYTNSRPAPYVRQPDPNDIANAYYAQRGNEYSYGCNYYGYNCVRSAQGPDYFYARQPDPNDMVNNSRQTSYYQYGCDYYGRNCTQPSSYTQYPYMRQPDPNDIANYQYPSNYSYYSPQYDPYYYGY